MSTSPAPDYDSLDDEATGGGRTHVGHFTFYQPTLLYTLNQIGVQWAKHRRFKTYGAIWNSSINKTYFSKCVQVVLLMDKFNIDRNIACVICEMCKPRGLNKKCITLQKEIIVRDYCRRISIKY